MDLVASRQEVLDLLKDVELDGEKLRVVTKLTDINPPCAYVALDSIDHYNVGGEVAWRLYLVAPNTDEDRAVTQLQDLLNVVLDAPGVSPADVTQYVGLRVPEQSQALPALFIKLTNTN